MLFTDTDSVTYEIKSKNVYEEFFKWKDLFDFSNYSKESKFFNETNKKVIGKMNDKFGGVIIIEFVRLKPKMHSIKKLMVKNDFYDKISQAPKSSKKYQKALKSFKNITSLR